MTFLLFHCSRIPIEADRNNTPTLPLSEMPSHSQTHNAPDHLTDSSSQILAISQTLAIRKVFAELFAGGESLPGSATTALPGSQNADGGDWPAPLPLAL